MAAARGVKLKKCWVVVIEWMAVWIKEKLDGAVCIICEVFVANSD